MSVPPTTYVEDHSHHWFPPRTDGPSDISVTIVGSLMTWHNGKFPGERAVRPWGQWVDPVNGLTAGCSDYPHKNDTNTFHIDARI